MNETGYHAEARTLGEMTLEELIVTARGELNALRDHLERGNRNDPMFDTITGAYLGSAGARLVVAELQLREA